MQWTQSGTLGSLRHDVDKSSAEFHEPVGEGEERIVIRTLDVMPGLVRCTALAKDDRADRDRLSTVSLDAAELGITVASVARGTLTFLMCHNACSSPAAVSPKAAVALFTFLLIA